MRNDPNCSENIGERVYTDLGWVTSSKANDAIATLLRVDPFLGCTGIKFGETFSSRELVRPCLRKAPQARILPARSDVLSFLYALSRGQRLSTPKFSSAFVGSYGKTFFRRTAKLSVRLSQQSVTEIAALADCFIVSSSNEKIGATRQVFEEFMLSVETLAMLVYTLSNDALLRADGTVINADARNCAVKQLNISDDSELMISIMDSAKSFSDSAAIVIGCMLLGCTRDHTVTKKDLGSASMRRLVTQCIDLVGRVDDSPGSLFNHSMLDMIKKKSYNIDRLWIIDETGYEAENWLEKHRKCSEL